MWNRVSGADFSSSSNVMGNSVGREWRVCEEYQVERLPNAPRKDIDSYLVVPKYPDESVYSDKWRTYKPLEDTPDLFLKFARLHRARDQRQAMFYWVSEYGVLGNDELSEKPASSQYAKPFREAVSQAAGVLALYEAVLSKDNDKAKSALLSEFPFVGARRQGHHDLPDEHPHQGRRYADEIARSVEGLYEGDYIRYALMIAANEVQSMVSDTCTPALNVEEGARTPSGITVLWRFRHLLGAMYLQMYWLMVAGNELIRCEYCGRLISLARPNPEGRKRRRDKRFCDDACRQSHHRAKKRSLANT